MWIEVTKVVPPSKVGVLASPDHVKTVEYVKGETYDMPAELAEQFFLKHDWGKVAPEPELQEEAVQDEPKDTDNVDTGTHDLTVPEVRDLIAGETDVELLKALRRGEREHPAYEGGRSGVIDALDERIGELEE